MFVMLGIPTLIGPKKQEVVIGQKRNCIQHVCHHIQQHTKYEINPSSGISDFLDQNFPYISTKQEVETSSKIAYHQCLICLKPNTKLKLIHQIGRYLQ